MSCVVDKAKDLKVIESDSHFSDFTGIHPSKIKQGKLDFLDLIISKDRENVMKLLCKKHSPYVYLDFYLKNKTGEYIYIHCIGQNVPDTTYCRLALADVSQSAKKTEKLQVLNKSMANLVEMVEGGVCVFKVNQDMQFTITYMNSACCRLFGTAKGAFINREYKLDELIYKDDKSTVYQAIGNTMATKKPIDLEIRVITHKNRYTWCKINSAIQRYDDDGLPVFHAIFTDISKIKEAEYEADKERDVLVELFKNLPGPQFCTDLKRPFRLDVVSRDFMGLIGYTRTELFETLGGDFKKLIAPEDANRAEKDIIESSAQGNISTTEYTVITKENKRIKIIDKRKIINSKNGERRTLGILQIK